MELDPVEYVVIEFKDGRFSGDIVPAIASLVERDLIHIIDLVFVRKDEDGSVAYFEYDDLDELAALADIDGEADGLLNEGDISEVAAEMEPGSASLFILWEDTWAGDLGRAIRSSGGRLVAGQRLPHHVVEAALAGVEADDER